MGHHSSGTKRFLLRPHLTVHFFPNVSASFPQHPRLQQLSTMIRPSSCRRQPKARCRRSPRCRRPSAHAVDSSCCPSPPRSPTTSLARCLARLPPRRTPPSCQLPAIPHVGKVGVGVSRPQRTTAMPTSSAIQDAAAATVPAPIRVAYK
ncbi:hypothetical protein ACLOJK_038770 [Asimina triloba]